MKSKNGEVTTKKKIQFFSFTFYRVFKTHNQEKNSKEKISKEFLSKMFQSPFTNLLNIQPRVFKIQNGDEILKIRKFSKFLLLAF